jgi:hypothetical protein
MQSLDQQRADVALTGPHLDIKGEILRLDKPHVHVGHSI